MEQSTPPYQLIETSEALSEITPGLARELRLAVDLEADSLYHHREKICLIQLATRDRCYLLDTLTIEDCRPLGPIFANEGIQKILHGADYDIRSLFRDYQFTIRNLFDTELAARFLGLRETGLEALLGTFFNVHLDKRFQRTDWSQRPLTAPMLEYGGSDVLHLIPLADWLTEKLAQQQRLDWIQEENEWLTRARPQPPYLGALFLRFKGARDMDPRSLAVLESLLQYRLGRAEAKDRPVFKIMGAEPLRELALKKPQSLDQFKGIKGLSSKMINRMGEGLIEAIQRGLDLAEADLPHFPRTRKTPTPPQVSLRVKSLKSWREAQSGELALDPGLILNNAQIEHLARITPKTHSELEQIPELKRWQLKAFGEAILGALSLVGD